MTPNKTKNTKQKRDSHGHYIPTKPQLKKLGKEAAKELKQVSKKGLTSTLKPVPPSTPKLITVEQQVKILQSRMELSKPVPPSTPKPITLEQQVKILQSRMELMEKGMSNHQKAYLDNLTKHSQEIHGVKNSLESFHQAVSKHTQSLDAFFTDPNYATPPNAYNDRKALTWLHKLKDRFESPIATTNFIYPPTREEVDAIAKHWAIKPVGMIGTWGVYAVGLGLTAIASALTGTSAIFDSWAFMGFFIALLISYAIWKE